MVLRLTSPKVATARGPRDEKFLPGAERARPDEYLSGALRESSGPGRELDPSKNVVAADVALDWVLQEIVQQARLATTATGAFIGVMRAHKIVCQATNGSNAKEFVNCLNRDRRIVDECLRSGAVQICRDSEASEVLDGSVCRFLGARCVVIVPVLDEAEKQLGVFGVFSPQADAFSNANIVALQGLARRIADATAQVGRCTSVPSGDANARLRPALPLKTRRRRGSAIASLAAGFLGILAILLLVGWTLGRAVSKRAMHESPKPPAVVTSQAASSGSADEPPQAAYSAPAQPSAELLSPDHLPSEHLSSNNASTNPPPAPASKRAPVAKAVIKPELPSVAVTVELAAPASAVKKVPASSGFHVPDLEIENALDDVSSGPLPAGSVDISKAFSQPRINAMPRSTEPDKRVTSLNAGYPPLPSTLLSGSPAREAIQITRAPEPPTIAPPTSSAISQSASPANPNSASGGPVMIPEQAALERVVDRVKPEYPEDAMAQHVQGTVIVDVIVGKDGHVEGVTPVDGDSRLLPAAVKAVRKWGFAPLLRNGHFVSFETHITLHFALP